MTSRGSLSSLFLLLSSVGVLLSQLDRCDSSGRSLRSSPGLCFIVGSSPSLSSLSRLKPWLWPDLGTRGKSHKWYRQVELDRLQSDIIYILQSCVLQYHHRKCHVLYMTFYAVIKRIKTKNIYLQKYILFECMFHAYHLTALFSLSSWTLASELESLCLALGSSQSSLQAI